jgi:steroid delta-isomerase-like uncharacterized protein
MNRKYNDRRDRTRGTTIMVNDKRDPTDAQDTTDGTTSSNRDRKARVQRFLEEVWNQGDADAAARYLAPRYTIHHDPGDPWDGQVLDLEGYKARLRASRAPCPDQRFTVLTVSADDEARIVVATWQWRGTHTAALAGFAPTGRLLHMTGATVYSFDEDERLTGHWQVVDRLGVFQQLRRHAETAQATSPSP